MKLSEYQNQIYKNNKNILELYKENLVLKNSSFDKNGLKSAIFV